MTQAHKTPGNLVKIKDNCFDPDDFCYPFYNEYINHEFEVVSIEKGNHITLKCLTGLVDHRGRPRLITVHDDEIVSTRKK